jgi:ABC-type glycerol-3-phosphate transport system substrate-binding protein
MITNMTGCQQKENLQGALDNEILTTTPVDQEKTMITVRVEFGAGQQEEFEQVIEEKFPDVDIVLRHDGSTSSVQTVRSNLEAGVECDLILSRRLPLISDIAEQYLFDLSSEEFVDAYYMNAVDSCANSKGDLYYLPGPSDVYGIVYDKTMFEENGWQVPNNYSQFIELLDTIRKTGIVPLQGSIMYPDSFQILFNTFGYEDVYAGSDNFIWLSEYRNGVGSMVGHMEPAVEDFKKLFDDGMLSLSDFEVTPAQRSEMMYVEHSTAMIIECQNALSYERNMNPDTNDQHEIAMMPFFTSDEEDNDYLYSIPSYYMAINKSATEESEEKKKLLLDIYTYLSSIEGQTMLIGDDFQVSNIEGVPLNKNSFSEGIIDTIERGQIVDTFYLAAGEDDKQVERQMLSNVKDMLLGTISVEEWLSQADAVRNQYAGGEREKENSYGQVTTTLTRLETAYTMAQMYAELTNAPIGLCYGGGWDKSTNGYLYEGDITDSTLSCITPDKEQQAEDSDPDANCIVTAELTGEQILSILNDATPESTNTKGMNPYYVAYGLTVEFAPWAEEGQRVRSCKLSNGEELDLTAKYEVAYFNGSLRNNVDVEPKQVLDLSWQDAFLRWLEEKGGVINEPKMTLTLQYE